MKRFTLALLLVTGAAAAADRQYQFRSVEDPAFPPDPAICAAAPFRVNVKLGASLWSQRTRAFDGKVVEQQERIIGRATACVQLTNFSFPPGLQQNFYAVFDLPSGRYTATGTCTLISNDVPQAGLVLAGCNLKIVSAPAPVKGGAITSLSTFNPVHLPGFNTGSVWTVLAYLDPAAPPGDDDDPHRHGDDHGGNWSGSDDGRSDEEIDAARRALESP